MVLGNYAIVIIHTAYREVIYSLLTVGIINTIKQPAKILGKWTGFILKEEILVLFPRMKNGSPVFSTNQLPEDNPIHLIIQQLLQLQDLQHAQTDYQSSVLIHQLLNELLLQKYRQDFTYETIPSLVLEMKAYIDQHFKETISLEDLAQLFHLNKYQLNKEFSKYIGLPPIKYQISKNFLFKRFTTLF